MKKIAAITMVRNDDFYLRKWVEYYGRELGKENLYIYFDGVDQEITRSAREPRPSRFPRLGRRWYRPKKGVCSSFPGRQRNSFPAATI